MAGTGGPWRLFSVHVHDAVVCVRLQSLSGGGEAQKARNVHACMSRYLAIENLDDSVAYGYWFFLFYLWRKSSYNAFESLAAQIERAHLLNAMHDAGGRDE